MKEVIFNKHNLKETDINKRVYRSRALMINSDNEILLGFCMNTYQFPGGYAVEGESLSDCLRREVLEETGIEIENKDYEPFYVIKHYNPNHPEEGINRYTELNYFFVNTEEKYNINNMNLDEGEKEDNFELRYIKLEDFEKTLKDTLKDNPKNEIVYPEMLGVMKEYNELKS